MQFCSTGNFFVLSRNVEILEVMGYLCSKYFTLVNRKIICTYACVGRSNSLLLIVTYTHSQLRDIFKLLQEKNFLYRILSWIRLKKICKHLSNRMTSIVCTSKYITFKKKTSSRKLEKNIVINYPHALYTHGILTTAHFLCKKLIYTYVNSKVLYRRTQPKSFLEKLPSEVI